MLENIVFLMVGYGLGAISIWLIARLKLKTVIDRIKHESLVELTRKDEQLTTLQNQNEQLQRSFEVSGHELATAKNSINELQQKNAKLEERTIRIPELQQQLQQISHEAQTKTHQQEVSLGNLREKLGATESGLNSQTVVIEKLEQKIADLTDMNLQYNLIQQKSAAMIAQLETQLKAERGQFDEKLNLLQQAEDQLSNRFKTLAHEILDDKSKKFTEQNKLNLDQLLEPLKVKITEFQGRINEVYFQETKERSSLAEQVKQLMLLNQQLSNDAHNLTSALKGQSKVQGNWGELILERVLEASGLRKGQEYHIQMSHLREDGSRGQPDVVIQLPEERNLVIDAKVSLTAYEAHANCQSDTERSNNLKRHLESINGHIKGLSAKNYQQLYQVKSLDFVLMFIPVEPAFMLAISEDSDLWLNAWKKNVLLVSPSTLLFVVRTVAHLWRQEQQSQNAQHIASRGAELYDKLFGFVTDLEKLGTHLDQAARSYDNAHKKLTSGKGNLLRQAEMLKDLGVKPTKQLPAHLIETD